MTTGCQPSLSNVKLRGFASPFTSTTYCTDQSTDDTSTRIGWSLVKVKVNGPRPQTQSGAWSSFILPSRHPWQKTGSVREGSAKGGGADAKPRRDSVAQRPSAAGG